MKKVLTDALVRSVQPPATGRLEIVDLRSPGLELRVTPTGARSFSFRFRDRRTGELARFSVGPYPAVSLSEARVQAEELRRGVAAGRNPIEERRRERAEAGTNTFGHLADRYLREHARRFKRTAAADERNLRLHVLPHWGERRFADIRRADVIFLCESLIAAGATTNVNRVQALVSSIYSFAVDASLVEVNPCHRLRKRVPERTETRVLSDEEIAALWHRSVLPPVSRTVGLALRLALLTAARASEVAEARRQEFEHLDDPARAAWRIPASRVKTGREHYLPLPPLAVAIVREALGAVPGGAENVFPSPRGEDIPIGGHALTVALYRLAQTLDGADPAAASWQADRPSAHDIRRSCATRLSELGAPPEDVAAVLNHARRDVTGVHYDRHARAAEKRRALTRWAAAVERIVGLALPESDTVLTLPMQAR